jgi:predicted ATPase
VNPALFYFQGIEHLDDASQRVLQLAPRELAGIPLFIMGVRADGATNTGWDELIALEPLTETPSAAMIRNLLKGPLPAGLHERILAVTGGIPWLIVDAVKRMVAAGSLVEVDGRHVVHEGLPPPVPLTMDQARRRQLDELPPALYAGLTIAAVAGDTFWLEMLEALDVADAARVCRELEEREFIRALPFSRYPGTRAFAFRSVFFREIVYDALGDGARCAELHRRIAQWMTERFRGDIREVAELGRHEERGGNDQAALAHYQRLGDIARACAATGIARECYRLALANVRTKADQEALEQRMESVRMTASRP